jgi:ABC-type nitrate/sulfonate/bicarbonate transport system substrate-binding protein
MLGSPWDVEARRLGLKIIADSARLSLPRFQLLGVNVQRKYLASNREVVFGFVKGLVEGVRHSLANKEETKQIVGRWLKLTAPGI